MINHPKVTIGLPTYNRGKYLNRAIKQILSQTFNDFELVIYNDGSTDNTRDIIKSLNDDRIIFIDEIQNKGIPFALNKILDQSKGMYIIILHDHDIFNPRLIEKSVEALDKYPSAGFVLQACSWIDSDEKTGYQEFILELPKLNEGTKFARKLLLETRNFASPIHACCMIRSSAFESVGKYYDTQFGYFCDIDLWFRLLSKFDFVYIDEVLFTFTGREKNHPLSKQDFKSISLLYQIHQKYLPIFFDDYQLQKKVKKRLIYTKYKLLLSSFIYSLFIRMKTV